MSGLNNLFHWPSGTTDLLDPNHDWSLPIPTNLADLDFFEGLLANSTNTANLKSNRARLMEDVDR